MDFVWGASKNTDETHRREQMIEDYIKMEIVEFSCLLNTLDIKNNPNPKPR